MSETRSIKCDACGDELIVDSPRPANYILKLSSIDVGVNTAGIVYAVLMHPPIDSTKHFCNKRCLLGWARIDSEPKT